MLLCILKSLVLVVGGVVAVKLGISSFKREFLEEKPKENDLLVVTGNMCEGAMAGPGAIMLVIGGVVLIIWGLFTFTNYFRSFFQGA